MTIRIQTTKERVIAECNIQTSFDLQAMRVREERANDVYDDWVMDAENKDEIDLALEDICADMAFALRTVIPAYETTDNDIIINVTSNDVDLEKASGAIRRATLQHIKMALLAWWYHFRAPELSNTYGAKAADSLNKLFSLCISHSGRTIGSYF